MDDSHLQHMRDC